MCSFGQNGEERIAKILNEATKGLNVHGLSPLGPHKDVTNPHPAVSLALPISQVRILKYNNANEKKATRYISYIYS